MRSVPIWKGKNDDASVPIRVRLRVFERYGGVCQCGCTRRIAAGERWDLDHIIALINGGSHSEDNMHPLLTEHHKNKTKEDVAEKSAVYAVRSKHLGLRRSGRPMPGSRNSPYKITFNHGTVRR